MTVLDMETQEEITIAKEQLSFLAVAFGAGIELGEKQSRGVGTIISRIEKDLPAEQRRTISTSHAA
ncbi:hypothetical protein [Vibrio hepatarius]|uniref:hypothetical protein n=1 Tax=Vibrio hepatarius TaxID=171383 RepID=UPI002FDB839F